MRSLWRLLLLVLLAVALPVQAFAAAGAVHCARMHERMHAAAVRASQDQHAHHGTAGAHHDMSADGLSTGHASASPAGEPEEGSPLHAFKCSACAACCVAMGLPAATLRLPSAPVAAERPSLPAIAIAAFVTGGLDRPPRTDLA